MKEKRLVVVLMAMLWFCATSAIAQTGDSVPWTIAKTYKHSTSESGETVIADGILQKYLSVIVNFASKKDAMTGSSRFRIVDARGTIVGKPASWNVREGRITFEGNWGALNGLYLDGLHWREPLFQIQVAQPIRPRVTTTVPHVTTTVGNVPRVTTVVDRPGVYVPPRVVDLGVTHVRDHDNVIVDHSVPRVHHDHNRVVTREGHDRVIHVHDNHGTRVVHDDHERVVHVHDDHDTTVHVHNHHGHGHSHGNTVIHEGGHSHGGGDVHVHDHGNGSGTGPACAPGTGGGPGCAPGEGSGPGSASGDGSACCGVCGGKGSSSAGENAGAASGESMASSGAGSAPGEGDACCGTCGGKGSSSAGENAGCAPGESMAGSGAGCAPGESMAGSGAGCAPGEAMAGSGAGCAPGEGMAGSGAGCAPGESMAGSGAGCAPGDSMAGSGAGCAPGDSMAGNGAGGAPGEGEACCGTCGGKGNSSAGESSGCAPGDSMAGNGAGGAPAEGEACCGTCGGKGNAHPHSHASESRSHVPRETPKGTNPANPQPVSQYGQNSKSNDGVQDIAGNLPADPSFVLYVATGIDDGPGKVYQVNNHGRILGWVNLPQMPSSIALHRNNGLVVSLSREGGKIVKIDDTGKPATILEKDSNLVHPIDVAIGGDSDVILIADNLSDIISATSFSGQAPKTYRRFEDQQWTAQNMSIAVTKDRRVIYGTDGGKGIYRFSSASGSAEPILPKAGGVAADTKSIRWAATQNPNQVYVFEGDSHQQTFRIPNGKSIYRQGLLSFGPAETIIVAGRDSDSIDNQAWLFMIDPVSGETRPLFPWTKEKMTDFVVGPRMHWEHNSSSTN